MTALHLILPVTLALLLGGCAGAGASLRDVLTAGGWTTLRAEAGKQDGEKYTDLSGAEEEPSVAPRLATRPFFVAAPRNAGEPLPTAPIPRAEFPDVLLSDALLYLLRNVTLQLAVDAKLEDRSLSGVVLEGDFGDALAQLARKGDFLYYRKGNVLHIESAASYQVALPPVGYVGPRKHREGKAALPPFRDLVSRLEKAGARNVTITPAQDRLTFDTSVAGQTPVREALAEFRRTVGMTAWKLTALRLKPGPLAEVSWAPYSPDLKPLALEGQSGKVRAYAGRFDAAAIKAFLTAMKQDAAWLETGTVLLPENLPVSFGPAVRLCPAARSRKPASQERLTLQTRRTGDSLRTNLTTVLPGCALPGASMAFTGPASDSVVLAGVGGNLVLVLEPQQIRFADAAGE